MPRRIQLAAAQRHPGGRASALVAPEAQKTAAPALPVDLIASGEVEPQAPNVPAAVDGDEDRVFVIGGAS